MAGGTNAMLYLSIYLSITSSRLGTLEQAGGVVHVQHGALLHDLEEGLIDLLGVVGALAARLWIYVMVRLEGHEGRGGGGGLEVLDVGGGRCGALEHSGGLRTRSGGDGSGVLVVPPEDRQGQKGGGERGGVRSGGGGTPQPEIAVFLRRQTVILFCMIIT